MVRVAAKEAVGARAEPLLVRCAAGRCPSPPECCGALLPVFLARSSRGVMPDAGDRRRATAPTARRSRHPAAHAGVPTPRAACSRCERGASFEGRGERGAGAVGRVAACERTPLRTHLDQVRRLDLPVVLEMFHPVPPRHLLRRAAAPGGRHGAWPPAAAAPLRVPAGRAGPAVDAPGALPVARLRRAGQLPLPRARRPGRASGWRRSGYCGRRPGRRRSAPSSATRSWRPTAWSARAR